MTCGLEAVIRFAESTSCRPCFCDLVTGAQSLRPFYVFCFLRLMFAKHLKRIFIAYKPMKLTAIFGSFRQRL